MSRKRQVDQKIERATEQIRQSRLSDEESREIAERVWARLENRAASGAPATAEVGTIRGCDDYQALIGSFLAGDLAPSRALLLEDHTRQCVPCRRALKAAREGRRGAAAGASPRQRASRDHRAMRRWAAAAVLAVTAGGIGYLQWNQGPHLPYGAIVESQGAGLYRADTLEPLAVGDRLDVGERVRTAPGESSMLRLADGSRVEVRGRSQLAVESARRGTTLRVEQGDIIVEAAPQGSGRLFVSTLDFLVSVKGTIFAVGHGTKGSRVAVVEGEVKVDFDGQEQLLYAGDRTTTWASFGSEAAIGFDEDLAWSQNLDRYLALLQEVTELRKALARDLPRPDLRYSSRLLDLAPDDMAFYAAFPNLAETLAEAQRIVEERIADSPILGEWWSQREDSASFDSHLGMASSTLAEVAGYLGDEIVVTAGFGADGDFDGPVVMAELVDPAALRLFVEDQIRQHGDASDVVFYEPGQAVPAADGDRLVIWIGTDTLVAAPRGELVAAAVARLASGAAPPAGDFKRRLAEVYRAGAEILIAADVESLIQSQFADAEARAHAERAGLLEAKYLILQQKHAGEQIHNDAVLAFDGPRRGVAAWLAEPGPMGSLRYISPDAKLLAAGITARPATILDEMVALAADSCAPACEDGEGMDLAAIERELGFDPRELAAALGGEVAFALDGPVIPKPAWKLVVEVYDADKLTWGLERLLAAVNDKRREQGEAPLEWVEESADGRTYYGVSGPQGDDHAFRFTYDEGYLVAAPNRALVDRAIRFKESGYTLESSARFTKLLPADGRANFSALLYQDALALLEPLAEKIAESQLTDSQRSAIEALRGQSEPTLAYAYGEPSRIVFAARGVNDLLAAGLPGILGLGGALSPAAALPGLDG